MQIDRPRIYTTREWGAAPPKYFSDLVQPVGIVLHHTTDAAADSQTIDAAFERARQIQRDHLSRGWSDTGQHLLLCGGGAVLEGRHGTVRGLQQKRIPIGAHAGHPTGNRAVGIEMDGYFHEDDTGRFKPMSQVQYDALLDLLSWLCHHLAFDPRDITIHRDWASTACPGSWITDRIGGIRKSVQFRLQQAPAPIDPTKPRIFIADGGKLRESLCHARVENGVTRVELRAIVEDLGFELDASQLKVSGRLVIMRGYAEGAGG